MYYRYVCDQHRYIRETRERYAMDTIANRLVHINERSGYGSRATRALAGNYSALSEKP